LIMNEAQEVYCPRCKKRATIEDRFCRYCGKRLPTSKLAPAPELGSGAGGPLRGMAFHPKTSLLAIYVVLIVSVAFNGYQYLYLQELRSETAYLRNRYDSLSQSHNTLSSKYDGLKSEITSLYAWLSDISNATKLRVGMRPMELVTPSDTAVAETVSRCTGGWANASDWQEYWTDLMKMYEWVKANIGYSYDTPTLVISDKMYSSWLDDYWKYPRETLMDGHGDCEDQALLLCSMIRNYNHGEYDAWVVLANGHAAVMLPTRDGKLTILDPAESFFTRTTWWQLTDKPARDALQEWGDHCKVTIPSLTVLKIFNEKFERSFSENDDFLSWFQRNYAQ